MMVHVVHLDKVQTMVSTALHALLVITVQLLVFNVSLVLLVPFQMNQELVVVQVDVEKEPIRRRQEKRQAIPVKNVNHTHTRLRLVGARSVQIAQQGMMHFEKVPSHAIVNSYMIFI